MRHDRKQFRKDFDFVRREFFPRWDLQKKFKLKIFTGGPWDLRGRFNKKDKKIMLSAREIQRCSRESFLILLIHEISHCYGEHHGKRFVEVILKKARRAEKLNMNSLAENLRKHVNFYTNKADILTAWEIYNMISDAVRDQPKVKYKDLIRYIAYNHGFTMKEFKKRYKKSWEVFRTTKSLHQLFRRLEKR